MNELDGRDERRLTRRQTIGRGAGGLLAVSSLPALLAACGGSSSSSPSRTPTATAPAAAAQISGSLKLLGYPDWFGPKEFSEFHARYPKASVKNLASGLSGAAQQIAQLAQNKGSYDLTLAGVNVAQQMKEANLIEPFAAAAVPNVQGVGATFLRAFPYGIPTDFGRTGYGYRRDLIPERPTSWRELWQLAARYSGKTTMIRYDADIQGSALRYLGYSVNTRDPTQLAAMQRALLQIKPHLRAIVDTDYSKQLIQGTAFFAIDYDYDIAVAQASNKNIVWVHPTEGMAAYLEGWIALNASHNLPAVWALMNFHLEPKNYASFVNATGTAYVLPTAEPYIRKSIVGNPTLKYSPASLAGVEFEQFLGAQQTANRGRMWEAFLAA